MKADMNQQAAQYIRQNKNRKRIGTAVAVLSVLVALLTTYVLMLPGITMEYDMICGLTAHQHTEECYASQPVCGLEETPDETVESVSLTCDFQPHTHTADCYNQDGRLSCGIADRVFHTHNDNCYDEAGNLLCTLENAPRHTHGDHCYQVEQVLSCTLEETEGHQHTDSCKAQTRASTPDCGLTESDGHSHDDSCWTNTLTCTVQESAGHVHEDACYQTESILTCTIGENAGHIHDEACMDEAGGIICGHEAGEGSHTHEEGCYTQTLHLICGQEEGQGAHGHGEACYTQEIICEKTEGEGAHHHSEACYPLEESIVCGMETGAGAHFHSNECYTATERLTCTLLHQHESSCFEKAANGNVYAICGCEEVQEHQHSSSCRSVTATTVEGHTHTAECNGDVLVCGMQEHEHSDACYPEGAVVATATPEATTDPTATPEATTDPTATPEATTDPTATPEAITDPTATPEATAEPTATPEVTAEPTPAIPAAPALEEEETDTLCGIPAHRHAKECLDENGTLVCGYSYDHTHGELCFIDLTDAAFYCGMEEHLHGYLCFDEHYQVICGYSSEHRHSYECLEDPSAIHYYCGLEEHFYDEDCFDENMNIICGKEHHEHTADCRYACGKREHIHGHTAGGGLMLLSLDDSYGCYDENGELICTLTEHTHSDACNMPAMDQVDTLEEGDGEQVSDLNNFGNWVTDVTLTNDANTKYDPESKRFNTAISINFEIPPEVCESSGYDFDYQLPAEVHTSYAVGTNFPITDVNGTPVGSFTICTNSDDATYLSINFDQDKISSDSSLKGNMFFGCSLDASASNDNGDISIEFEKDANLTIKDEEIDRSVLYSLSTQKTGGEYNAETNSITYTVTVKSKGTPEKITIADYFTINNATVKEWSVQSVTRKQGDTTETLANYTSQTNVNNNNANMTVVLPKVEPSENEVEYQVIYIVSLDDLGYANVQIDAKNSINVSSKQTDDGSNPNNQYASAPQVVTQHTQTMLEKTSPVPE